MQFLADVSLVCEACGGRRYRTPVLEVRYKGQSIDQVLDMTVHEAVHFFSGQAAVVRRLKLFEEIGLGYLRLGQSATTLSGGEAQRIKLAAHLARKAGQRVALRPRRAHHRACTSATSTSCSAASTGCWRRGRRCSSSSTTWTWSSRRTG